MYPTLSERRVGQLLNSAREPSCSRRVPPLPCRTGHTGRNRGLLRTSETAPHRFDCGLDLLSGDLADSVPPPARPRAEPLSHRLPLKGGVIEASTRLPVELYHSPLEGESQKPSRRRRLMRRGAIATPQSSAGWQRLMRWGGKSRLRTVRRRQRMKPTRERGRPARTRLPAASFTSSTWLDRQRRQDPASTEPMPYRPAGWPGAASRGN